jgi:hypothetical protein
MARACDEIPKRLGFDTRLMWLGTGWNAAATGAALAERRRKGGL